MTITISIPIYYHNISNYLYYLPALVGVVDVDVHVSSHLKEEPSWAVGKRLRVISTIILFKKQ